MVAIDPTVTGQLGQAHPLAPHVGDFLTDLANAGVSGHTLRACSPPEAPCTSRIPPK